MRLRGWARLAVLARLLTWMPALLVMGGCRGGVIQMADTRLSSATSPDGNWRAVVVKRDFLVDGHFASGSRTFVLLDRRDGGEDYEPGEDFSPEKVVAAPMRCGTLSTHWGTKDGTAGDGWVRGGGESQLHVVCEQCGISLASMGPLPDRMGAVEVVYERFPEQSSWERPWSAPVPVQSPSSWRVPELVAQRLQGSMRLNRQTWPVEAYAGGRRKDP